MLARQAWELIALPELPKQKEQVQKDLSWQEVYHFHETSHLRAGSY